MIEPTAFATPHLALNRAAAWLPERFTIPVHDAGQALELLQLMRCLWWCWLSTIAGRNYSASTTYDPASRVDKITYPNGHFATRMYDQVGGWNQLIGGGGNVLWQGGAVDAEAHYLNWMTGVNPNNAAYTLTSTATFGANTGRLATLTTSGTVQNLALTYDGFGNIRTRLDAVNGYCQSCLNNPTSTNAESYRYDTLNQLTTANTFDGAQNLTYDGFGRILTKTGVNAVSGSYQYLGSTVNGSTTSHRVQTANGRGYTYDLNGSVDTITSTTSTSAGQAAGTITLSWTSFNQPMSLPVAAAQNAGATATGSANAVITLKYGPDNERRLELLPTDNTVVSANQTASRYILHSGSSLFYDEDVRQDGSTEQRVYLAGPLGIVAMHATNADANGNPVTPTGAQTNAQNNNGTPYTLTYWHRDHLGSLTVTTDENSQVKERMRYDPWGKPLTSVGSTTRTGERGFTGHEHLSGGLIHMNGRVYDPVLGRFLSADIVVQMPGAIVSYNRYAYVMNNPLGLTDPSGYFFVIDDIIIAGLISAGVGSTAAAFAAYAVIGSAIAAATGHTTASRRFLAAAITIATAGTSYAVLGAFAAGGVQSGSLEGAVLAGLQAGFFAAAGGISDVAMFNEAAMAGDLSPAAMNANAFNIGGLGRAGMHFGAAAAGAMLRGGDPLRSGFSAGFAEIAGPLVSGTGLGIENFAAHVVAGGIGEVMAGGKFQNGAMTGAFAWLYNHCRIARYRNATNNTITSFELRARHYENLIREVNPSFNFAEARPTGGVRYTEDYAQRIEATAIREVNNASSRAVNQVWRHEADTIRSGGSGTRDWTFQESRELLTRGRVSGYEVDHIQPVSVRPDLAGSISNLQILSRSEHLRKHSSFP